MSVAETDLFDEHGDHHEQQSVVGGPSRIVVTQEGVLDPSLLIRTEGYMYKKGGAVNARGGFRNWKRRYFVLVPVDFFGYQGYELQYYDVPNGTLKGTVALNDVDIFVDSRSENKKVKFEFQLILQNGGELQLSCDSEEEREEWVRTLQVIINFLQKVATQPAMMLDGYDPMMEDDIETYHIGEELAQNCQAFGPGLFGSEAGKSTQFVVNIHDLTGQRVAKGGMPMVATITNDDSIYYLAMVDNDDGSFYCNYVLGKAGKYQLSITLNEEHHIFGSPFDIEILPSKTVPKFCRAEGEGLEKMATNATGTFIIHAMDGFGNYKTRGGDPFEVSIMGPGQVVDLEDRGDGSYACVITTNGSTQSQSIFTSPAIMIMISLYGKAIEGSPFKPVMLDGMRAQSFLAQATNNTNNNTNNNANNIANSTSNNLTRNNANQSSEIPDASMTSQVSISGNNSVRTAASQISSVKQPQPSLLSTPKATTNSKNSARASPPMDILPPASSVASVITQPQSSVANISLPPTPVAATQPLQTPSHQTAPSPATSNNGQGLSRLERSRQRALLAKSLAEQNTPGNIAAINVPSTGNTSQRPQPIIPPSPSSPMNNALLSSQNNQTATNHMHNNSATFSSASASASATVAGGRLAQLAARSKMTLEALKNNQNNTSNPNMNNNSSSAISQPPHRSSGSSHQENIRNLLSGLLTDVPPEQVASTQMEQRVWQQVHQALTHPAQSRTVLDHIVPHLDVLQQVYICFADRIPTPNNDAEMVLRLATARGYGGLLKMLEMYEVIPHFLNRLEAKTLFNLAMASQKLLRSPAQNGLDFPAFVKFLLFVANCALNKAQAFAEQYATPESRVDFILIKLGLGDLSRFQNLRRALLNANATDI